MSDTLEDIIKEMAEYYCRDYLHDDNYKVVVAETMNEIRPFLERTYKLGRDNLCHELKNGNACPFAQQSKDRNLSLHIQALGYKCPVAEGKRVVKRGIPTQVENDDIEIDINNTPSAEQKGLDEKKAFLKLPIDERRKILSEQADKITGAQTAQVAVEKPETGTEDNPPPKCKVCGEGAKYDSEYCSKHQERPTPAPQTASGCCMNADGTTTYLDKRSDIPTPQTTEDATIHCGDKCAEAINESIRDMGDPSRYTRYDNAQELLSSLDAPQTAEDVVADNIIRRLLLFGSTLHDVSKSRPIDEIFKIGRHLIKKYADSQKVKPGKDAEDVALVKRIWAMKPAPIEVNAGMVPDIIREAALITEYVEKQKALCDALEKEVLRLTKEDTAIKRRIKIVVNKLNRMFPGYERTKAQEIVIQLLWDICNNAPLTTEDDDVEHR